MFEVHYLPNTSLYLKPPLKSYRLKHLLQAWVGRRYTPSSMYLNMKQRSRTCNASLSRHSSRRKFSWGMRSRFTIVYIIWCLLTSIARISMDKQYGKVVKWENTHLRNLVALHCLLALLRLLLRFLFRDRRLVVEHLFVERLQFFVVLHQPLLSRI